MDIMMRCRHVVIGAISLAALMAACGEMVTPQTRLSTSPTSTAIPTASPAISTKTTAPEMYPLAVGGLAHLGGTVDAFTTKWGEPSIDDSLHYNYARSCGGSHAWCVELQMSDGKNGQYYVQSINLQGSNDGEPAWTYSTARAICESYVPQDAHFLKVAPIVIGNRDAGIDRVYYSQTLASLFPPDQFTDIDRNPIDPGTFDINYMYAGDASDNRISYCILGLGFVPSGF